MKPFGFKHFSIRQTQAAMKVGTDSMLLGALCNFEGASALLDIGTGTGVLALMIAQRFNPETLTAVEMDDLAFEDARENLEKNPFTTKIDLVHTDIRSFNPGKLFDGIITNPPFFENSSQSSNAERNLARHTNELSFEELFTVSSGLLKPSGKLWIILPADSTENNCKTAAKAGLFLQTLISIEGKPGKTVRSVMEFGKTTIPVTSSNFTVRNENGSYTDAYIELTKEFHGVDLRLKKD